MKLKKFISVLVCLGLLATFSIAKAQTFTNSLLPPNSTPGEEAGTALGESFLSLTSAIITRLGVCAAGTSGVTISVNAGGNGSGTYDTDIVLNILRRQAAVNLANAANGNIYDVTQAGAGVFRGVPINSYAGIYAFGIGGAIMTGSATFNLIEFNVPNLWDEHIIKDFWTQTGTFGKIVRDDGLEVITKINYPRSKWRQTSFHQRPDGGQGLWSATKTLVTINNVAACTVSIAGTFASNFGGITFAGAITVTP